MSWRTEIAVAGIVCLCVALLGGTAGAAGIEAGRTVHRSTDFGWAANQDVTEAFTKVLTDGTLKAGDELVLEHTYRVNIMRKSPRELPANFTLSAVRGAGFDVYGLDPENPNVKTPGPVLVLGDRNTLRNLSIVVEGEPSKVMAIKRQAKYFKGVASVTAHGKDDILIENCLLNGLVANNLVLAGCRRPKVIGCHIVGGFWSIYVLGGTSDAIFWRCLFEKSTCDSIKTVGGGQRVCKNLLVENCVFQDNACGDGIDTTGGLNNSIVRDCTFRRLGVSGMDIKAVYHDKPDEMDRVDPRNNHIRIERCTFLDMPNSIVVTSGGEALTADNIRKYAVHDIDIDDCLFGHVETPLRPYSEGGYGVNFPSDKGEHMRAIFLKDGYNIRYRNLRYFGERLMPVFIQSHGTVDFWMNKMEEGARQRLRDAYAALGSDKDKISGNATELKTAPPTIKPGATEVPFAFGPQETK